MTIFTNEQEWCEDCSDDVQFSTDSSARRRAIKIPKASPSRFTKRKKNCKHRSIYTLIQKRGQPVIRDI